MQHDIEIIPGTSGTVGHELGLVLNYKIPASGMPVDLSGAELVFIASAGGRGSYQSHARYHLGL